MATTIEGALSQSTRNLCTTMLGIAVTTDEPRPGNDLHAGHDFSAIISYTGNFVGSALLGLPRATAVALVRRLVGSPIDPKSTDFTDAIGEMANMIFGGAKSLFSASGTSISCPIVMVGGERVAHAGDRPCKTIECRCPEGQFYIEFAIVQAAVSAKAA